MIPKVLRHDVLRDLLLLHQGATKLRQRTRLNVYWPNMDGVIMNSTRSCDEYASPRGTVRRVLEGNRRVKPLNVPTSPHSPFFLGSTGTLTQLGCGCLSTSGVRLLPAARLEPGRGPQCPRSPSWYPWWRPRYRSWGCATGPVAIAKWRPLMEPMSVCT